jgi:hypothetical protein
MAVSENRTMRPGGRRPARHDCPVVRRRVGLSRGRSGSFVVLTAVALAACSGHKSDPGLTHAQAACAHWATIDAGINDLAQRKAVSAQFTSEATAAAAADSRYTNIRQAAQQWQLVLTGPTSLTDVNALQQAITDARTACAGVPKK